MRLLAAAAAMAAAAACGPGLHVDSQPELTDAIVRASGDEHAIRAMLLGSVTNGGLYFTDPACAQQFGTPGDVLAPRLDAFAHCLAGLHWQESTRTDPLDDVAVLTYAPGFEIEARLEARQLLWIGYVSHRDVLGVAASVTPAVFDQLRTSGDRDGPLEPAMASALVQESAWFLACIDEHGTPTGLYWRELTSAKAAHAFADAAAKWAFKPFLIGGQAIPVCSLVRMSNPSSPVGNDTLPLPNSTRSQQIVSPRSVEAHRIAGSRLIEPDDVTKSELARYHLRRLVSTFKLCLDASGNVTSVVRLRRSVSNTYDLKLMRTMKTWKYSPFVIDGEAQPVCTSVTFIYTQN